MWLTRRHVAGEIACLSPTECQTYVQPGMTNIAWNNAYYIVFHYCRSGNFRVFKFSQISDFETFHKV